MRPKTSCLSRLAVVLIALVIGAPTAEAIGIDLGSPDLSLSWGNTIRYNLGMRVQARDKVLASSPNTDESDALAGQGDLVANRADLLSEVDFDWQKTLGFRVSGAGWYDPTYPIDSKAGPGLDARRSYTGSQLSAYTKRYVRGPYAEVLDAYGFANLSLADRPLNLKVGRHVVLWGEAVALSAHSVSYAQAPSDGYKALANPGVDAKETALPVGQASMAFSPIDNFSVSGQWFFEWQPTRLPQGGTFLSGTDFILQGPDQFSAAPTLTLRNDGIDWPSNFKDWGANVRWKTELFGGTTVGAYYRTFTERTPTVSINLANRSYRAVYPEDAKLYGLSATTNLGGVSFGAEAVRREDTALASSISNGASEGARGTTWHGLLNAVAIIPRTSIWSQMTVTAELAYSRLDQVTSGENFFSGCYRRPAGDQGVGTGCSTKDAWQGFLRVGPSWIGVAQGWDLAANASLLLGLKGNSAVLGGGNEGAGSYGAGVTATYNLRHDISLAYNGYLATRQATPAGTIRVSNGSQIQDRGWVAASYKVSF